MSKHTMRNGGAVELERALQLVDLGLVAHALAALLRQRDLERERAFSRAVSSTVRALPRFDDCSAMSRPCAFSASASRASSRGASGSHSASGHASARR